MLKMKINSITKELLYKDNESDIVIGLIGDNLNNKIFKYLSNKSKYKVYWNSKDYSNISKFNYNDENYIIVDLKNNIYEFTTFYNPLIIIFVCSGNIKKDLKMILKILEINNNLIVVSKNENIKKCIDIPVTNIEKLKYNIWKISFQKKYVQYVTYKEKVENSINTIKSYLLKQVKFDNLRFLSILLLTDYKSASNLIYKYLDYDIDSDIKFQELINTEINKFNNLKLEMENEINFTVENLYNKIFFYNSKI